MNSLSQGETGPLKLKIERKIIFPVEEWLQVSAAAKPEQRRLLNEVLNNKVLKCFTWWDWDTSSKRIEEDWPFIKSCLKLKEAWRGDKVLTQLFEVVKTGNVFIEKRGDQIYEQNCEECLELIELAKKKLYDGMIERQPFVDILAKECTHINALGEPMADKSYVMTLQQLSHKVDEEYHVLKPALDLIKSTDKDAGYHPGPVKSTGRMTDKLNEYVTEGKQFPRAACMIDPVRLSVAFDSADQILAAFKLLDKQDDFRIVRYKNKYRKDTPMPFRNLMVNVQMDFKPDGGDHVFQMIGELQLTTLPSIKLKKVQHKFYEILRAFKGRSNAEAYKVILKNVCKVSN